VGVEEALRNPALAVEIATNVYEALAMLAEPDGPKPRVVVVSIEGLSRAEMEFFELVPRACGGLPVYVYGSGENDLRDAEAIAYGATDWADPKQIESLACEVPPIHDSTADDPAPASAPLEEGADQTAVSWPRETRHEPSEDEHHDERDDELVDEADEASAVRVPWLRYPDRPARAAPSRTPPQESPPDPPRMERAAPPAHTPLLTDEELQALIGDDIASLAPHRTAQQDHDDSADEERSR
jgi:hypothetical protein